MQKESLMLEIGDWERSVFEKFGLTPEQARDKAIEILESVRFNPKLLQAYMNPVEEILDVKWEVIAGVIEKEDDVRDFASYHEDGLYNFANALSVEVYLTTD